MGTIKVAVHGALGRMGEEVIGALCREPEMQLVGAVDVAASEGSLAKPDGSGSVPLSSDLDSILKGCQPDVLVDFTIAKATMPAARIAAEQGVNLVIGTSGITTDNLDEIARLASAHKIGAVVVANFALGAVLMMHLAKIAGKYFDYAEIIELHHERKLDAPSGTSLTTARDMVKAKGKPFLQPSAKGAAQVSRGQAIEGISIHSVRLPGMLAHQEVILGGPGQTLSIRHDTINRECYMPGVIMAVKEVVNHRGLIYGLDKLLGLGE